VFLSYHGPADSTPSYFLSKYPVGICCPTLEFKDIRETLQRLLSDMTLRQSGALARRKALEEELGLEVMVQRFASLLNVDRRALLPL
jgi:hypothetical protein